MDQNTIQRYTTVCNQLMQEHAALEQQIRISNINAQRRAQAEKELAENEKLSSDYKNLMTILRSLTNEAVIFLGERAKNGSMAVNAALLSARNVVPDAMSGVRMHIEGKEMWLENEDGMLVERMEGGGFRAACSLFCRKVALASNPETIQLLILDELLAKLSNEASVTVSQYLPIMSRDMQIIIIEQKKEVYAQSDCTRYNFFLAGGKTVVEREVLRSDEQINDD